MRCCINFWDWLVDKLRFFDVIVYLTRELGSYAVGEKTVDYAAGEKSLVVDPNDGDFFTTIFGGILV